MEKKQVCNTKNVSGEFTISIPPPFDEQDTYDYEESLVKKRKDIGVYWKRPVTKVYDDNFGFSVNGYQPMIDFLDSKDFGTGVSSSKQVHLPYEEERCMRKYHSRNPIKYYENFDIDKFIDKGEKIRTRIRQNDAAGSSNVIRRTHTKWSMTNKAFQSVKNSSAKHNEGRKKLPETLSNIALQKLHSYPNSQLLSARSPNIVCLSNPANGEMLPVSLIVNNSHVNQNSDFDLQLRRRHLDDLQDQYEKAIKRLNESINQIDLHHRNPSILNDSKIGSSDVIDMANNVILDGQAQRACEMRELNNRVDSLVDNEFFVPSHRILGGETRWYREPSIMAADYSVISTPDSLKGSSYIEPHIIPLPVRYIDDEPILTPRRLAKKDENIASDVQLRIINRANEMAGASLESIRIRNKARCINHLPLKPKDGDDFEVSPTQTEENISNIAKSFAQSNFPDRRQRLDKEEAFIPPKVYHHISDVESNWAIRKPESNLAQGSHRLRNAKVKARARTLLLVD